MSVSKIPSGQNLVGRTSRKPTLPHRHKLFSSHSSHVWAPRLLGNRLNLHSKLRSSHYRSWQVVVPKNQAPASMSSFIFPPASPSFSCDCCHLERGQPWWPSMDGASLPALGCRTTYVNSRNRCVFAAQLSLMPLSSKPKLFAQIISAHQESKSGCPQEGQKENKGKLLPRCVQEVSGNFQMSKESQRKPTVCFQQLNQNPPHGLKRTVKL